uniref:Uncharacterized LOC103102823 n=1 Tax=Monodelphis domestica TaxID=13616 RepID=K7DYU9_MONDO
MGRKHRIFSEANLLQVPLKSLCHQDKSALCPCPPHWVASLSGEDPSPQTEQVPHIKHQSRTKLSQLPGHRTTATQLSYPCKRTMAAPLPHLDHQSVAKSSSVSKCQSKATVLPSLCPEYKTKATAMTLPCKDQWVASPSNHNELIEAAFNSSHWTEIPSRHEHIPKMPQPSDHQIEEGVHLNQRSTAAGQQADCGKIELPARPYSQAQNSVVEVEFPSPQTKAVAKSAHLPGSPTPLSQSCSPQRTTVFPLPCLYKGFKGTAKKTSALNLFVKTAAPNLSHSDLHSKFLSSVQYVDHYPRARAALSLHSNPFATATTVLGSAYTHLWSPSFYLQGRSISKSSSVTKLQTTLQTAPSSRQGCSESDESDGSMCSDLLDEAIFGPLPYSDNPPTSSPVPDYTPKGEISTVSSHSDSQFIPPLCCNHCTEVLSILNHQDINSTGAAHRMDVLEQDNCWAIPWSFCSKKNKLPSALSENGGASLDCNYKETIRPVFEQVLITSLPELDHLLESPLCLAQEKTPPLVLSNHTNVPLDLNHCSLISLDQDHWVDTKLTSDDKNNPTVPNCLIEATVNTNPKAISPLGLDSLGIDSVDLHDQAVPLYLTHQVPSPPAPNHQVLLLPDPLHQSTNLPSSDHHDKDKTDTKGQGTLQSFPGHWETMFTQLNQKFTTPKAQNNQEEIQPGTTQADHSHQVTFPDILEQQTEVTKDTNNTQDSCTTTSDYQLQITGDPNNTQDSCTTIPEYQLQITGDPNNTQYSCTTTPEYQLQITGDPNNTQDSCTTTPEYQLQITGDPNNTQYSCTTTPEYQLQITGDPNNTQDSCITTSEHQLQFIEDPNNTQDSYITASEYQLQITGDPNNTQDSCITTSEYQLQITGDPNNTQDSCITTSEHQLQFIEDPNNTQDSYITTPEYQLQITGDPNNTQDSCITTSEYQLQITGDPNNTQDSCITTSEHQLQFIEDPNNTQDSYITTPEYQLQITGDPNNTQDSCITTSEYQLQITGDPNNTQDSCITTSEYQLQGTRDPNNTQDSCITTSEYQLQITGNPNNTRDSYITASEYQLQITGDPNNTQDSCITAPEYQLQITGDPNNSQDSCITTSEHQLQGTGDPNNKQDVCITASEYQLDIIEDPNNTQDSYITASEYQLQGTGDPNNTQDSYVTASEYQPEPSQSAKQWLIPLLGPELNTRTLIDYYNPLAQVEQISDPHSKIHSGLQNQIQTVQNNKATWCLNYMKPPIIEGGTVPIKIVNYIITSIPQETIKNDICKQILLRRMHRGTHQFTHLLCSYKVCLSCASWIPNGCFHGHAMKYSSQAQLLAIPLPVPGSSEEMGVKFVLQIPHSKAESISNTEYPDSSKLSPSCNSFDCPSSQSEAMPAKPSILQLPAKSWINLMFDTDYQKWARKTSSSSQFREKMPLKTNTTSQQSRNYKRFVKSFLYKFQRKEEN